MYNNYRLLEDKNFQFVRQLMDEAPFDLSFLNTIGVSLDEWKKSCREYIRRQMSYQEALVPFDAEIAEAVQFDGYTRQKVYFNSAKNCRIPAYLLIPDNIKKKAPGVLVMHDHGAMFYWGKEKSVEHKQYHPLLKKHIDAHYDGKPTASELARRGYVVLVPDCLFFGERRWELENDELFVERLSRYEYSSEEYILAYNRMEQEIEGELVRAIFYAGYTFMGFRMRDEMTAVNYLCSLPEVNPGRIGCIGLSMGGHRAAWLSAMDDRIKCSVVAGFMTCLNVMVEQRITNCAWMWNVPELYKRMDFPHITALTAPNALMVIHGLKDTLFPDESGQNGIQIIKKIYEKAGCPEQFIYRLFDGPHELNDEMQKEAYGWLDRHLL